jgi:hypothetical protein
MSIFENEERLTGIVVALHRFLAARGIVCRSAIFATAFDMEGTVAVNMICRAMMCTTSAFLRAADFKISCIAV